MPDRRRRSRRALNTTATRPEPAADTDATRLVPPIPARPARGSRPVFAVAEDDTITFSTVGILEAVARLPDDLAEPRAAGVSEQRLVHADEVHL